MCILPGNYMIEIKVFDLEVNKSSLDFLHLGTNCRFHPSTGNSAHIFSIEVFLAVKKIKINDTFESLNTVAMIFSDEVIVFAFLWTDESGMFPLHPVLFDIGLSNESMFQRKVQ